MGFRLPTTKGMLRRQAANWLARLRSGRDPNIERRFQRWYDADSRHSAAFDRVRGSYEQAGLLRHSPVAGSAQLKPGTRKPEWKPLPALAAATAIVILVPVAVVLYRNDGLPLGGTEAVMLMTNIGEIKQVDLTDGSKVTLDTATKVEVEIGRSHRTAHLRYGRARFQIAPGSAPFLVQTTKTVVMASRGVIDVEQTGEQDRIQVLAGAADVRGSDQRETSAIALYPGNALTMGAVGAEQKGVVAPGPDWTRGMLQFEATPLGDAVALANRYSKQHILIDENLGRLRVSGAFRAGDTVGLAKALAAAFHLSLRSTADGNLALSSKGASAPEQ